jgi:hypothetical protein
MRSPSAILHCDARGQQAVTSIVVVVGRTSSSIVVVVRYCAPYAVDVVDQKNLQDKQP